MTERIHEGRTMKAKDKLQVLSLCLMAALLVGCSGVREQFGLAKKRPPDEFRVVSRAPLSIPPDFGLRPPEPGAVRPQEGTVTDQARTAVFGRQGQVVPPDQQVAVSQGLTQGEVALLRDAGALNSDPSIRQQVDRESAALAEEQDSFINKLVFWRDPEEPGTVVDATAEEKRLKENEALGDAPTTGDTPSLQRKERAIFEGLFKGGSIF
jgi:hypothetical protein